MEKTPRVHMLRLQEGVSLLLDLSMRFHDLFRLHGGKLLGHDLQRDHLDMSGLRSYPKFWK